MHGSFHTIPSGNNLPWNELRMRPAAGFTAGSFVPGMEVFDSGTGASAVQPRDDGCHVRRNQAVLGDERASFERTASTRSSLRRPRREAN